MCDSISSVAFTDECRKQSTLVSIWLPYYWIAYITTSITHCLISYFVTIALLCFSLVLFAVCVCVCLFFSLFFIRVHAKEVNPRLIELLHKNRHNKNYTPNRAPQWNVQLDCILNDLITKRPKPLIHERQNGRETSVVIEFCKIEMLTVNAVYGFLVSLTLKRATSMLLGLPIFSLSTLLSFEPIEEKK